MKDKMREAFESQKFKVFSPFKCNILKNEDGNYVHDETIFAFEWFMRGYKAALSAVPESVELSIKSLQLPEQEPAAYRVIASANGEVVRDSLEFTRMSEIDEKVVRQSYELRIVPLYSSSQEPVTLEARLEYSRTTGNAFIHQPPAPEGDSPCLENF